MRHPAWSIASVVFLGACTVPGVHDGADDDDHATGTASGEPTGGSWDSTPPMCDVAAAPGTLLQQLQLAPDEGLSLLVANTRGELAYAGPSGITRLAPDLHVRFTYPYGSVVALDPRGAAFIAGPFTQPTDFGTGVIAPVGNIDTFLVGLSPMGQVMLATSLGQCGDGIESIAISPDHRIAISGAAMGTIVTDRYGTLLFSVAPSGKVAFTSHGVLVVGGSASNGADTDGLVSAFSHAGKPLYSVRLGDAPGMRPHIQTVVGVAAGPHDTVAVTGAFREEMVLFGTTLTTPPDFPSGQLAGSFIAKLDFDGEPVWAVQGTDINANVRFGGVLLTGPTGVDRRPGTPLVVDAKGNVTVSSDQPGNAQPPFAYPQLTEYATNTGAVLLSLGNATGTIGAGLGVALDACGNAVWAAFENAPSIFDPHTLLARIGL